MKRNIIYVGLGVDDTQYTWISFGQKHRGGHYDQMQTNIPTTTAYPKPRGSGGKNMDGKTALAVSYIPRSSPGYVDAGLPVDSPQLTSS